MKKTKKASLLKQRARNQELDNLRADTVCPFFIDVTSLSVQCQCAIHGATGGMKFKDKNLFLRFHSKYCCSFVQMKKCPHHKLMDILHNLHIAKQETAKAERLLQRILPKNEH
ncbi:MAG: hypothetical protein SPL05_06955 [Eubacteriales bacterium]|nr:hypothetical protein [Eubacteriales bacterium]